METGSGPALLFLPGASAQARAGSGHRIISETATARSPTSLLGYGPLRRSDRTGNSTLTQQVDVIDRIIDRIARPRISWGTRNGGLAAIAHALAGRHAPASLVLVEANPLGLLRSSGDLEHYAMFESMTGPYFADVCPWAMPRRPGASSTSTAGRGRSMRCREGAQLRGCDHGGERARLVLGNTVRAHRERLQSIAVPTTVVRGGHSHPAMLRIAERLHEAIPRAQLITIEGGSHFLPSTHPAEVAALVRRHVDGTRQT